MESNWRRGVAVYGLVGAEVLLASRVLAGPMTGFVLTQSVQHPPGRRFPRYWRWLNSERGWILWQIDILNTDANYPYGIVVEPD